MVAKAEKVYLYCYKSENVPHLSALLAHPNVSLKTPRYSYNKFLWQTGGIRKDLKRHHIRIYHGLSGTLPLRARGCKSHWVLALNDLHLIHSPKQYGKWSRMWRKYVLNRSCHKAERITVPSEWGKQDIIKQLGVSADRIDVVPPCCSDTFTQPALEWAKDDLKRNKNLPDKYVLAMGPIEQYKNMRTLVEAIMLTKDPSVKLVLVGSPTNYYTRVIKKVVSRLDARDRVVHVKHVRTSDLPALYQMSMALACPAVGSYYSISMLEAMSSGIPVMVSKGTALEQQGGNAVISVQPDSPQEWAQAIDRLCNQAEHEQYAQLGLEKAKEFSMERMGQALKACYDKIESSKK